MRRNVAGLRVRKPGHGEVGEPSGLRPVPAGPRSPEPARQVETAAPANTLDRASGYFEGGRPRAAVPACVLSAPTPFPGTDAAPDSLLVSQRWPARIRPRTTADT